MNKEKIENILKKVNIEIKEIKSATNSFNSNVYNIKSEEDKKYVLKFCNNEKKMINESKYMKYLKQYLPVSDVIETGQYEDKYYIIQSFFEGVNKFDEDANNLTDEQVKNIGILLAKLHSTKLLEEENKSWITTLNKNYNKTKELLDELLSEEDNEVIRNYIKNYIDNNISKDYKSSILHMDFRIGNLMFKENNEVGLIDLESMKNGEYTFDFVKLKRLFNKDKFNILLDSYKNIKKLEDNFQERLNFYSLLDSYNSLWWCINKQQTESNFYKLNYKIVQEYLQKLKKTGNI